MNTSYGKEAITKSPDRRRVIQLLTLFALLVTATWAQDSQHSDPPREVNVQYPIDGTVEISLPSEMKVGQTDRVQVRLISTMMTTTAMPNKDRPWESYSTPGSRDYSVDLSGDGFRISGVDLGARTLSPGGSVQWDWDVTPEATGVRRLSVAIREDGGTAVNTYEREVLVKRNWLYVASKYASFFYLGLIVFIGVTMLVIVRYRERLGIMPTSPLGRLLNFISVYLLNSPKEGKL